MGESRPDSRVAALTYLTPLLLGLHSLLLPWFAYDDRGADELYGFWSVLSRTTFEESTAVQVAWWALALVGAAVAISCLFRAATPDAGASWGATLAAGALALLAVAVPVTLQAAATAAESDALAVRWGAPLLLALSALWVAGACFPGTSTATRSPRRGGWERPASDA